MIWQQDNWNYIGRETHVLKVVGSNPSMDIFHINML